jgi:chromosome partitioning protein
MVVHQNSVYRYAQNGKEHGRSMSKVIAVANQKGGVGKTTSAVNIAASLGAKGKNTLLVDIDPQGNSTSGVGFDRRSLETTSYDILINGAKGQDAVRQTAFAGLSVIPSSADLAAAEIELADIPAREAVLKNALAPLRAAYDFILIDCPPSLGLITTNALNAADSVLIPVQCEYYALEGLSQLMNSVQAVKRRYNDRLELEGVLLTMYDGRLNLTQQVVTEIKKYFPRKVFSTVIPRTVRLSEAPSYGQPILYYDRSNKGAQAYSALTDEILKKNR